MAGTTLNFPYDAEIFNYSWKNTPDIILTTMLESGAVVNNAEIAGLISNGSNFFTVPYYNLLSGTEDVYNGVNSFTGAALTGGNYSGVVYGRMSKWTAKSFIKDFNSGADPMSQIVAGVAKFWQKARQTRFIGVLTALFGITGDSDWSSHIYDIAGNNYQAITASVTTEPTADGNITVAVTSANLTGSPISVTVAILNADTAAGVATKIATALNNNATIAAAFTATTSTADVILTSDAVVSYDSTLAIGFTDTGTTGAVLGASADSSAITATTDAMLIAATTINDVCVAANGDHAGEYSLVICHSVVANRLANLQLLEYSKYTDAAGITRSLPIGTINGLTLIVNDSVPYVASSINGEYEYTTYILGNGAMNYATAPVDVPSEMDRDPDTNGGLDMIYTRVRECFAPNGFSFKGDCSTDVGVPDSVLLASASWERKMPAKSIFMAKLVTNG